MRRFTTYRTPRIVCVVLSFFLLVFRSAAVVVVRLRVGRVLGDGEEGARQRYRGGLRRRRALGRGGGHGKGHDNCQLAMTACFPYSFFRVYLCTVNVFLVFVWFTSDAGRFMYHGP